MTGKNTGGRAKTADTRSSHTSRKNTALYSYSTYSTSTPQLISGSEGSHLGPLLTTRGGTRLGVAEYCEVLASPGLFDTGDAAVYVHLPFCSSRCLSCDHVTTVTHDPDSIDSYLDHLENEFDMVGRVLDGNRRLAQLHLGGGTPNYLTDSQLLRLVSLIERHFVIDEATETSLEAAPKRTSQSQLQLLRGLGFKSVRFEVRDLDPGVQQSVGRSDSLEMLADVFDNARGAGFETISMDLAYGLPHQTSDSMRRSVDNVLALAPDRVACYSYSRRPDEFTHQRAIDTSSLPSLADRLIMFNTVVTEMASAGYDWVGLDNFSRPDDALAVAQAEHKLSYNWMGYNAHGSPNLLGFGASAVSELGGACVQYHSELDQWSGALDASCLPVRTGVVLGEDERRQRHAVNGLLSNMALRDYESSLSSAIDQRDIEQLEAQGVLKVEGGDAFVTEEGRFVLHHLCNPNAHNERWVSGW